MNYSTHRNIILVEKLLIKTKKISRKLDVAPKTKFNILHSNLNAHLIKIEIHSNKCKYQILSIHFVFPKISNDSESIKIQIFNEE